MPTVLNADRDALDGAIEALRDGRLVAFPTETVYGLGARAADPVAIARVYAAKGRPADNPLIVHVDDTVEGVVADWPEAARILAEAFWPGPLTLVARRHPSFPDAVSAGRDTVAVRCPDHPVARALIRGAGPLAAPSANRSGTPSPTRAEHVLADLGDAVAVVVDGGPCRFGMESTVVDVTVDPPMVLRPGAIPVEALEEVVGDVALHPSVDAPEHGTDARAPGMRYRHYSPDAEVTLVEGAGPAVAAAVLATLRAEPGAHGVLVGASAAPDLAGRLVVYPTVEALAADLYALLRRLDDRGVTHVVVGAVPSDHLGRTLLNRLRKAATHRTNA